MLLGLCGTNTSISGGALGCVNSGLTSLSRETELPTGFAASALFLAILKSGEALGVLLALSILIRALLLDAVGGILNIFC